MKTQNKAIAKDAALTGLPTLEPNDEPTKAQRDRWQREYAEQRDGALKIVKALNSIACPNHPYSGPNDLGKCSICGYQIRKPQTEQRDTHNWHLDADGVEVAKGQGEGVPDTPEQRDTAQPMLPTERDDWTREYEKLIAKLAHAERLAEALKGIEREASCLDGLKGDIPLVRFAKRVRKAAKTALAAWEGVK